MFTTFTRLLRFSSLRAITLISAGLSLSACTDEATFDLDAAQDPAYEMRFLNANQLDEIDPRVGLTPGGGAGSGLNLTYAGDGTIKFAALCNKYNGNVNTDGTCYCGKGDTSLEPGTCDHALAAAGYSAK